MSWLLALLEEADWGKFDSERKTLQAWEHYPLFVEAVQKLNREALYHSHLHGEGHIERVLLHGGMLALRHHLDQKDTALLLDACSYHDTGRVDDSVDHAHGARSARKLAALTDREGQDLQIVEAIVEAHSRRDSDLEKIIKRHVVADVERARRLALLLKDADGLDRVRLNDLDERYLRSEVSRGQVSFAKWLFSEWKIWEKQEKLNSK